AMRFFRKYVQVSESKKHRDCAGRHVAGPGGPARTWTSAPPRQRFSFGGVAKHVGQVVFVGASIVWASLAPQPNPASAPAASPKAQAAEATEKPQPPADYVLGPGDQIMVRAVNVEEIPPDKPFLIDMSGFVRIPVIGRVKVSGQTIAQVEADL